MKDLIVKITGAVQDSNFDEYKEQLLAQIKDADKELVTDEDFAHADEVVKACKNGEDKIKEAKAAAISSMEDVNKLYSAMDEVAEQMRQTRLNLSKQIKTEKDRRKDELLAAEVTVITDYVESIDFPHFARLAEEVVRDAKGDLASSMRGRSSLKSIEENLKTVTTETLNRISELHKLVVSNDGLIDEISEGITAIVPDRLSLLTRDPESLKDIIASRLATHKSELEKKRLQEEAEERRRREFEEAQARNETRKAEESMGENIVAPAPRAPEPAAELFSITTVYEGDVVGAQEAARMITNLFDDNAKITSVTLNRINNAA